MPKTVVTFVVVAGTRRRVKKANGATDVQFVWSLVVATSVGIIGGGASGIGVARALRESGHDFTIIEATDRLGGNWQPSGPASKMYHSAHLISSKKNTQFSDVPMPDDYPAYPSHSLMFDYLESVAGKSRLQEKTRFNTIVVDMLKTNDGWRLQYADGSTNEFEIVVVCNGLLRTPIIPSLPGNFSGLSIHSGEYRSAEIFRGKRVLVVGGGNSGCDIAVDAAQCAEQVFHSTRRGYHYMPKFLNGKPTQEWLMEEAPKFATSNEYWAHVRASFKFAGFDGTDYGLPAPDHEIQECHPIMNSQILYYIGHGDIAHKPDIAGKSGRNIEFVDGSNELIDVIVWATGFSRDMPFLKNDGFGRSQQMDNLFLKVFPQKYDDLLFVGYLNTPSGIGNLANILGRLVAAYVSARQKNSPAYAVFGEMKMLPNVIDLGQSRFINTDRHKYEVDLWKYIKAVTFVTTQFSRRERQPIYGSNLGSG